MPSVRNVQSLSANDTGTTPVSVGPGYFAASLAGTFVAAAKLQRSYDNGATWLDCASDSVGTVTPLSAPTTINGYEPAGALYRWLTTAYTSGMISAGIYQR